MQAAPQLPNDSPIIVLEAGATHNGRLDQAIALAALGLIPGITAVKYQTVWAGNLVPYRSGSISYRDYLGEHRAKITDLIQARELDWYSWVKLDQYCESMGVLWFSTPDIPATANMLANKHANNLAQDLFFSCCAIKVAGADMHREDLVAACANTGLRVLLDTRAGDEALDRAVELCLEHRPDPIIVHSPTGYPTQDPGLSRIHDLRQKYSGLVIGFTSHSLGSQDCEAAIAAGAGYIEKGITMTRKQPGIEHLMCLEPEEVEDFVTAIRKVYDSTRKP